MQLLTGPVVIIALIGLLASAGCETPERGQPPPLWTLVQITDPSAVAGRWEGILRRVPPQKRNDLVTIVIAQDGRFKFESVRTIGLLSGEGKFTAADGKLTFTSERGRIEASLFEANGQRMLKAEARAADGAEYNSELTQVK